MSAPANNLLIAGFVIQGASTKQILLRGIGPGPELRLPDRPSPPAKPSPAPVLALVNPSTGAVLATNGAWGAGSTSVATLTQLFNQFGAFGLQAGSSDDTVLQTLGTAARPPPIPPRSRVRMPRPASPLPRSTTWTRDRLSSRLINLSARASVLTGDKDPHRGLCPSGERPRRPS